MFVAGSPVVAKVRLLHGSWTEIAETQVMTYHGLITQCWERAFEFGNLLSQRFAMVVHSTAAQQIVVAILYKGSIIIVARKHICVVAQSGLFTREKVICISRAVQSGRWFLCLRLSWRLSAAIVSKELTSILQLTTRVEIFERGKTVGHDDYWGGLRQVRDWIPWSRELPFWGVKSQLLPQAARTIDSPRDNQMLH